MAGAHVPMSGVPVLVYPGRLRVLCVGGGVVATGKIAELLDGGAQVRVIAPEVTATLRDAADQGRLRWRRARYSPGDIGDANLVVAATDSPEVNAAVTADADAAGRLCVRVDDGLAGSAAMMGSVRRGPLVLGVSTTGAAPSLTRLVRRELADRYGPEHGVLAELGAELRSDPRVVAALADVDVETRRARWRGVYHPDILNLVRAGRLDQAKEAAFACLLSSSD
jgi:precorrin-2 dehydrogenase/sirohydrochlorin ferrochelatase